MILYRRISAFNRTFALLWDRVPKFGRVVGPVVGLTSSRGATRRLQCPRVRQFREQHRKRVKE